MVAVQAALNRKRRGTTVVAHPAIASAGSYVAAANSLGGFQVRGWTQIEPGKRPTKVTPRRSKSTACDRTLLRCLSVTESMRQRGRTAADTA